MLRVHTLCVLAMMAAVPGAAQTPGPVQPAGPQPAPKPAGPCAADPADSGPPVLRRQGAGGPVERKAPPACGQLPTILGKRRTPVQAPQRTLIDRVRERASQYTNALPDFICSQLIRRYQTRLLRMGFKTIDTVTVDVAYVRGKEQYTNAKRNGKPIEWWRVKWTGTYSEGEYGTILRDLLSEASAAEFKHTGKEMFMGIETEVYEYRVLKDNSHWTLAYGGHETQPAYSGRVWIDAAHDLVRRIEMEARDLAPSFPVNHAEMTLDYGPVVIDNQEYILPVATKNISCFTANSACVKNETEFRNYRKFTTESSISTTESTITFEGEGKKKK